jgi:hypothetical protein
MSGNEVAKREDDKDERIEPEIRIAESFGEGADADRLIPSRWKQQANDPSPAREGGRQALQLASNDEFGLSVECKVFLGAPLDLTTPMPTTMVPRNASISGMTPRTRHIAT